MISGPDIVRIFTDLGITHVVWLPDSALGTWEGALESAPGLQLVRVCREGEAWTIAAGLLIGGRRPIVVIQNTGLFESGDALRNVLYDLGLPLFAVIGYRSYLVEDSPDSARRFTEPVLAAWGIDHVLIDDGPSADRLVEHYRGCQADNRPGAVLIAEGRM